jgi:uncharacterized phage protein (TIGR01671 family)
MREIKFRAWNKKHKFMDSAWLLDFEHELVCHSKHNQSEMGDCELMQYTGYKDFWNQDIYDGDILKDSDEGHLWITKFEDGAWVVKGGEYNLQEDLIEFFDWKKSVIDLLIVGNIYQNKELLTA